MYILDTDILTLLFAGHPRVLEKRGIVPSAEIAITIVTQIEVLHGRFDFLLKAATGEELKRAQAMLDLTSNMLAGVEKIISIDHAAAAEFDRVRQNKKLRRIGRSDLLIASIALAHRATVVTRNTRHFAQVSELKIENWAD
jgi:tRNA(fMet)-specific endonuclease VapC